MNFDPSSSFGPGPEQPPDRSRIAETAKIVETTREGGLVRWQWAIYPAGHCDRWNLLVHALTVPIFWIGTIAILCAPFVNVWLVLIGLLTMAFAMLIQGRTHARERVPPARFLGPLDVPTRIFVEQWWTFPRFVITGGFARAWRDSV